jgi:hypothetical protein
VNGGEEIEWVVGGAVALDSRRSGLHIATPHFRLIPESHSNPATPAWSTEMTDAIGAQSFGIARARAASLSERLNGRSHKLALQIFMAIVLVHWLEHIVQAYQALVLHWPRPMSMGVLGMYYPWLMKTEVLHYSFALVILIGLWALRRGFVGRSHRWWMLAFWIQFWHHIEHGLLFYQALTHRNLFGGAVPTSVGQIWIPRIELHLIYNALVFIPMLIGMYYHLFPPATETRRLTCSCAKHRHDVVGVAA